MVHFLEYLRNTNRPVDSIIKLNIDIAEKYLTIKNLFVFSEKFNINLNVTCETLTLLLRIKSEKPEFLALYSFIIDKYPFIFNCDHLYHLVFQIWIDIRETYISMETRKNLIYIGLKNGLNDTIMEKIKEESDIWFLYISENSEVYELIQFICKIDISGKFRKYKELYESRSKEHRENDKIFRKINGITMNEFKDKRERTKRNGMCKFIIENKICPYGINCKFYHGRVQDTFGIQICKHGTKCDIKFCKFKHEPTPEIIAMTQKMYSNYFVCSNNYLISRINQEKEIDNHILKNPYFIAQKVKRTNNTVYYQIPKCCCSIQDEFGNPTKCNKPIVLMSRNSINFRFYCCYEHMESQEKIINFAVKQNILDKIIFQ